MLAALLKLVLALQWAAVDDTQAVDHEQLAISACVNAVQDMFVAKSRMDENCQAAGSIGAATIQRKFRLQGRQIGSLLSSIGGDVNSFLSSNSIQIFLPTAPTASATTSPSTSTGTQTTASTSQSTASSTSNTSSSPSDTSQSTASPTSTTAPSNSAAKGPSAGLIAGVVVGCLAFLALLGAAIWFCLRHRRNKRSSLEAQVPAKGHDHDVQEPSGPARIVDKSMLGDEKATFVHKEPTYLSQGAEMSTNANVWELDGREIVPVGELEASNVHGAGAHAPHPNQQVTHSAQVANEELFLTGGHVQPGTAL